MSLAGECQTPGAIFHIDIRRCCVRIEVELPFDLKLTEDQAKTLEINLHNVIELVLARYWEKQ